MSRREPLDALSALVMVQQAAAEDLVDAGAGRQPRWYCLRHLEDVEYRVQQKGHSAKVALTDFNRLIVRDDLVDLVRTGRIKVYAVQRPTNDTWHRCPHCRMEAARKHRR